MVGLLLQFKNPSISTPDVDYPMPLPPLYGHQGLRNRLVGALASGRLPQALLFVGPRGVGKQRVALWLAQVLVCETRQPGDAEPCQTCRACRYVALVQHPDVHWFVPLEPGKRGTGDADKQIDQVEEALGEELAARRDRPLVEPASGMAAHGIASVRLLLRRLALTPAMGSRKVFIIGDADRLVPQPSSQEAANALLKALEEPPADTVFILTTANPSALLPTVLSRTVRMAVSQLPDSVVTGFAREQLSDVLAARDLPQRVAAAQGCIGALGAGAVNDKDLATADAFRTAVKEGRYGFALKQPPFQARGGFTGMLDALLDRLREELHSGGDTGKLVAAISKVVDARAQAQGNVNPQLLTAVLAGDLAELE